MIGVYFGIKRALKAKALELEARAEEAKVSAAVKAGPTEKAQNVFSLCLGKTYLQWLEQLDGVPEPVSNLARRLVKIADDLLEENASAPKAPSSTFLDEVARFGGHRLEDVHHALGCLRAETRKLFELAPEQSGSPRYDKAFGQLLRHLDEAGDLRDVNDYDVACQHITLILVDVRELERLYWQIAASDEYESSFAELVFQAQRLGDAWAAYWPCLLLQVSTEPEKAST